MRYISNLVKHIDDEICDAKEYAECYLTHKAKDETAFANKYKEMANDELKHATYIHEIAVSEINTLKNVYTPTVEMEEMWDKSHKSYIERVAWVRQMLTM